MVLDQHRRSNRRTKILLYIPNIIGYVRLLLLLIAWYYIESPRVFLLFYSPSALLDIVDGYIARKFHQVSDFGAWLDVVTDIIGRGILWCNVKHFGYAVPAWEWLVFVANHARSESGQWRENFKQAPFIVRKIMKNGFNTILGTLVIMGIHILPFWLYVEKYLVILTSLTPVISFAIFFTLVCGRVFGFIAESWCVYTHILYLLDKQE